MAATKALPPGVMHVLGFVHAVAVSQAPQHRLPNHHTDKAPPPVLCADCYLPDSTANSASLEVGRGEPGVLSPVVSVGGDRKLRPLAAEAPLRKGEGLTSGEIWAACFTALLET